MKKLILVALAFAPFAVIAEDTAEPICTHTVAYTILNEDGDVMDKTLYVRNWPLSCTQSVLLRYETMRKLLGSGEDEYRRINSLPPVTE